MRHRTCGHAAFGGRLVSLLQYYYDVGQAFVPLRQAFPEDRASAFVRPAFRSAVRGTGAEDTRRAKDDGALCIRQPDRSAAFGAAGLFRADHMGARKCRRYRIVDEGARLRPERAHLVFAFPIRETRSRADARRRCGGCRRDCGERVRQA